MIENSKELRITVAHLAKHNLVKNAKFKPITSAYLQKEDHHRHNEIVTEIIRLTYNKYPLTEQEQQLFKKDPINFISLSTVIGIQNSKGIVYRVVRIERYKEYTYFCKLMLRNKFHLFVTHNAFFDILFR